MTETLIELLKKEEEKRKIESHLVTSYREAWNILTDVVPNYRTPDLSNNDFNTLYSEPFYCFSSEYFNAEGDMGDMKYAVSLITGKVYEYYSNGEMLLLH